MASKTQNFELNFDYDIYTDTYELFVDGNDENWEKIDASVGYILDKVQEQGIILPTPTTIGTETNYFKYTDKIVELKNRLYNILVNKGVSATANDTFNSLITKVGTSLFGSDEVDKYVSGTLTTFINVDGNTNIYERRFANRPYLTKVDLTGVTSIEGYAFYNCPMLEEVTFNGLQTLGDYAFSKTNLSSVELPNSLTVRNYVNAHANYCFSECNNLQSIILNCTFEVSSGPTPTSGDYMFNECSNLKNISCGNNLNLIPSYCFYNDIKIENINFGNIQSIFDYAFYRAGTQNTQNGLDLYFNNSCSLGQYSFYGVKIKSITCNGSLDLGKYCFSNCTFPESTFRCNISWINERAFDNCNLTKIYLGNSTFTVGKSGFAGCLYVNDTDSVNWNITNLNSDGFQFHGFGSSRSDTSTQLVLDLSNSTFTTATYYSFCWLANTKVILPSTVTSLSSDVFYKCSSLILVLNSFCTINNYTFEDANITKIMVPNEYLQQFLDDSKWSRYSSKIEGY